MQFKNIVGNEQVKQQLTNAVAQKRIPHAQLFYGPAGSAKLALAIAYAQYLNCENLDGGLFGDVAKDSCGNCSSCQKISKNIHPDVHFSYPFFTISKKKLIATDYILEWREALKNPYLNTMDWQEEMNAENKQLNIPIKECHAIRKKLALKSFEGNKKVLIMWLPEFLDKEGNVLLKLIEEPPENTIIILVAENQDRILTTIKSRLQHIIVKRFTDENIVQALQLNNVEMQKAQNIAKSCSGNLNVALKLVTEEANDYEQVMISWLTACLDGNANEMVAFTNGIASASYGREGRKSFINYVLNFLQHTISTTEFSNTNFTPAEIKLAERIKLNTEIDDYLKITELLNNMHYYIERNANAKVTFLNGSITIKNILNKQHHPTKVGVLQ